ncbi:hypothetical protein AWV79_21585 [Cupriavidus sp. UYMMa02A]|nr:hypothetical protein AWV79_21585 [Cupriavidus sp. UYMMa02A]
MMSRTVNVLASGLRFPEGPIAWADGSVTVVELASATIARVEPNGRWEAIAETGGSPNGSARGPDGAIYICNNGGLTWKERNGVLVTDDRLPDDYAGGYIQRLDMKSGRVETIYDNFEGRRLAGPNDIVFDQHGGFYFTDYGKVIGDSILMGGLYYGSVDGGPLKQVKYPLQVPNGIGLSPDGRTLYVAHTHSGWLVRWTIEKPGELVAYQPKEGEMSQRGDRSLGIWWANRRGAHSSTHSPSRPMGASASGP